MKDDKVWRQKCKLYWSDKYHIKDYWRTMMDSKRALRLSIAWGRTQSITLQEILDLTFWVAYRPEIGDAMFMTDPLNNGQKARTRRFLADGHIESESMLEEQMGTSVSSWRWQLSSYGDIIRYYAPWMNFPQLRVTHLPNWGWMLSSQYVLMTSFEITPENFKQLLEVKQATAV